MIKVLSNLSSWRLNAQYGLTLSVLMNLPNWWLIGVRAVKWVIVQLRRNLSGVMWWRNNKSWRLFICASTTKQDRLSRSTHNLEHANTSVCVRTCCQVVSAHLFLRSSLSSGYSFIGKMTLQYLTLHLSSQTICVLRLLMFRFHGSQ